MELGKEKKFQCFLVYIEVVLENTLLRQSAFGRLIDKLDYCDFGNEEITLCDEQDINDFLTYYRQRNLKSQTIRNKFLLLSSILILFTFNIDGFF